MTEQLTVKKIQTRLNDVHSTTNPFLNELANDDRKGVQNAVKRCLRRLERLQKAQAAFQHRFLYENALWQSGNQYVAGIDEVGRGPLAGPVVACAVILDSSFDLLGVTDSKMLTRHEREQLYLKIVDEAVEVSIGVRSAKEIDRVNVLEADKEAMTDAINALEHDPSHLIIDAVKLNNPIPQTTLIKGDQKSISVAAASIVAKEYRDHLMADYDRLYPQYGFAQNMGYGTKKHLQGLAENGPCPIHRRTFAPVDRY